MSPGSLYKYLHYSFLWPVTTAAGLGPDDNLGQHAEEPDTDQDEEHQVLHFVPDSEEHLHLGRDCLVRPGHPFLQHEEGQHDPLPDLVEALVAVPVHQHVQLEGGVGGESGAPLRLNVEVELVFIPPRGLQSLQPLPQHRVAVKEVRPGHVDRRAGLWRAE